MERAVGVDVSIHAPGRGATTTGLQTLASVKEFQFTHPGGVRRYAAEHTYTVGKFQFTHPGGVRRQQFS